MDNAQLLVVIVVAAVGVFIVVAAGLKIVSQFEKGLIERFGRYNQTVDPGLRWIWPFIERIRRVDMREQVVDVPPQEVITEDNVVVTVDAVVYYRATDPVKLRYNVANFILAATKLAQTNLRNIIGDMDLDEALTSREAINTQLRQVLDEATDVWGTQVVRVEIQRIDPPPDVTEAMHRQMKAERERRAIVTEAEGDKRAAILRAEGVKESRILEAQGQAQAIREVADADKFKLLTVAEGEGQAIERVFGAIHNGNPSPDLIAIRYLDALARIADGKANLASHAEILKRVEAAYGVDAATVVAVWGVESNFGNITGNYPLVQALGTLSCFGRRQGYFKGEFFAALRILQRGDIAPERLNGSWAGAFGHTQFMPATYERLAVDFDGDGRRDLVDNSSDALASTANFLRRGGWQSGQPWGFEVRLPAGFNTSLAGRKNKRALSEWADRGVVAVDGRPMADTGLAAGEKTAILIPAGPRGPAFIVTRNFDVIYGYNAAESYALAIAHLSDRLRGAPPFATPWPTDDPGLSRAERRELQTLLVARGHDIGAIDGALGDKSRAAIKLEQSRLGQEPTGRGGQNILLVLRAESGTSRPVNR